MQPRSPTRAIPPAAAEVRAHCRRTAAVASLISHRLPFSPEENALLYAASVLHHHGLGRVAPKTIQRLLADVFDEASPAPALPSPVPEALREVLNAYEIPGSGTPLASRLAGVLRLADAFDQGMEAQPIYGQEPGEIVEGLRDGVEAGLWPEAALNAMVESTRAQAIPPVEAWRVPVFPQAALRILNILRDPRAGAAEVAHAASLDPATAGLVMRLANSALFGPPAPISTLPAAITRLGFAATRKAILSAALSPVFRSPRLETAWPHSLEVADLAEQLAALSGATDPAEAYLAGLLHDVGRIALLPVPLYDWALLQRLERQGCPPVYAENLLLGTDHAAWGAQIAAGWRLPDPLVMALRHHHRPENASHPLVFLLYLAEFLSASEEDLPSIIRLEISLKGLGLAWADVADCRVSPVGCWLAAA